MKADEKNTNKLRLVKFGSDKNNIFKKYCFGRISSQSNLFIANETPIKKVL